MSTTTEALLSLHEFGFIGSLLKDTIACNLSSGTRQWMFHAFSGSVRATSRDIMHFLCLLSILQMASAWKVLIRKSFTYRHSLHPKIRDFPNNICRVASKSKSKTDFPINQCIEYLFLLSPPFSVCHRENGRRWRHKAWSRLHGNGKSEKTNHHWIVLMKKIHYQRHVCGKFLWISHGGVVQSMSSYWKWIVDGCWSMFVQSLTFMNLLGSFRQTNIITMQELLWCFCGAFTKLFFQCTFKKLL